MVIIPLIYKDDKGNKCFRFIRKKWDVAELKKGFKQISDSHKLKSIKINKKTKPIFHKEMQKYKPKFKNKKDGAW